MSDRVYAGSRLASVLAIIAGAWLCLAAYLIAGTGEATSLILGFATIVLAAICYAQPAQKWLSWLLALLGLWTIASPWSSGFASNGAMKINDVIVGIIVTVLAVWAATTSPRLVQGREAHVGV